MTIDLRTDTPTVTYGEPLAETYSEPITAAHEQPSGQGSVPFGRVRSRGYLGKHAARPTPGAPGLAAHDEPTEAGEAGEAGETIASDWARLEPTDRQLLDVPTQHTEPSVAITEPWAEPGTGLRAPPARARSTATPPTWSSRTTTPPSGTATQRDPQRMLAGRFPPRFRGSWPVFRGVRLLTLLSDLFACALAGVITNSDPWFTLGFTVVLAAFFNTRRLYRSRLNLSVLDDLPAIAGRWLMTTAVVVASYLAVTGLTWSPLEQHPERFFLITALALVLLGRSVAYTLIRRARAARRVGHRTLILGASRVGELLATILRDHPEYGLNPIGFLDPDPHTEAGSTQLPVLGGPELLAQTMRDNGIHIVVVAFPGVREDEMVHTIRTCDRLQAELFVVPRLYELHHVEGDMDSVWGMPLIRLRRSPYRSWTWPVKRVIDMVASAAALVVLGIPMALIALSVRLDSGPGVIFRQERVGVNGYPVTVLKFRSMRPADEHESRTRWNISTDVRISKLGKFLRRSSLDELPQLFNILRGEMSIVGPRPERPHFVDEFQQRYRTYEDRHRVPCGLTGLAQVYGLRGDTSIEERARLDNYYIQNWSLWLDAKIVVRTIGQVLSNAGG